MICLLLLSRIFISIEKSYKINLVFRRLELQIVIQDIHPHTFNNVFIPDEVMTEESYVFVFSGQNLLLKQVEETVALPRKKDLPACSHKGIHLFTLDGTACFWLDDCPEVDIDNFIYHEIRFLHNIAEKEIDFLSGVALHLKNWYEQHQYCGKCGSKTAHKSDERALVCTSCGHIQFPTVSPAIIVAVISGDNILLAHGVNFREGLFSLIAGYTDVGETIEETVVRELEEEVGIEIKNLSYYKSQPWAFSGSLMLGFIAEGDHTQTITIDPKEIAEAHWYHRDALPNYPPDRSIAGEIIDKFRRGEL